MFGFSIYKIFFTIAVIIAVWQGFKWLKRREHMASARSRKFFNREKTNADDGFEDLVYCANCKAYVPKGSDHKCV